MSGSSRVRRQRQSVLFLLACAVALLLTLAFGLWIELRIGGITLTEAVDDFGEAVAGGIGAAACVLAAVHNRGRTRIAWALLGGCNRYRVVITGSVSPSASTLGIETNTLCSAKPSPSPSPTPSSSHS